MSDIYAFPEQDSKLRFSNFSGPKGWVLRDLNDSVLLFAEVLVIDEPATAAREDVCIK
jgi:hypothetical protein